MKHTIAVLAKNKFGVLARISGLFSARGFNIESLAVGETETKEISRLTIEVIGDEKVLEQVMKQLNKLIDVIKVFDLSKDSIKRELFLIKLNFLKENRSEIIELVNIFKAKILDVSNNSVIIELASDEQKINSFLELIKPFGIKEIARTGKIAMLMG